MNPAHRVIQGARAIGFVGVTAAMLPAYLAANALASRDEKTRVRDAWVHRWSSTLLALFSINVTLDGEIPPRTEGSGRLVVSNHRSAIDIGVVLGRMGGVMVSRGDLASWPVLGPAARSAGTIFVDRGDASSGAATVRAMRDALERGDVVNVFPEGTTFDGDDVRPFHRGAFIAAASTRAEILPIGIAYAKGSAAAFTNETFPAHLARMAASTKATRVVMCVGTPLVLEPRARANTIATQAHDAVQALVTRARSVVDR